MVRSSSFCSLRNRVSESSSAGKRGGVCVGLLWLYQSWKASEKVIIKEPGFFLSFWFHFLFLSQLWACWICLLFSFAGIFEGQQ